MREGDGRDEIILGTTLADDDGKVLWRKQARNHADCTAIFQPFTKPGPAVLISICNSGPACCLSASAETIWEKTTKEYEERVRSRLHWGTSKSHVAVQAFAVDLCGDERDELALYQPYHGESIMIFTQPDSEGRKKTYVHQKNAYNIHSYF